jgi:putative DNA primase/helicase
MSAITCQTVEPWNQAVAAGAIPEGGYHFRGINHDLTADWITRNYSVLYFAENGRLMVYDKGVYCEHGELLIKGALNRVFSGCSKNNGKALLTNNDQKEIISRIQTNSVMSMNVLYENGPYVNIENGVLNLETLEISEHTPFLYFLNKSPVRFVEGAECTAFKEFEEQALDKKYHPALEELLGYALWPDYRIQKAFMLLGPKRAGKGTFLRVLVSLVGDVNCSHVSLQDLAGNRFKVANLFGKMVNSFGDLPKTTVLDVGIFKSLTGEDYLEGERKFEGAFNFMNRAKLVYSANSLPALKEVDDAYFGRWGIFPFERSFFGSEDADLTRKLTTPAEMSGVLNLALAGLQRLKAQGWKFSYMHDGSKVYQRASNPVIAFLEEGYQASSTSSIAKSQLIAEFNGWAKVNGFAPAASTIAFSKAIKEQSVIPLDECKRGPMNEQVECWMGIMKNPS